MAENGNGVAVEQQQTGQGAVGKPQVSGAVGRCTGDCKVCTLFQRQYCASQISYNNMRLLERMEQEIVILKGISRLLNEKLEAIQNNEAMLMDPIAQEGDGAK